MSTQSQVAVGALSPFDTWGSFANISFTIRQFISKVQTATLVKVIACTNNGALSPIGTVDVQPCVNQVDSAGNPYPHTTIFNVPYLRIASSGGNAVILDPTPGDIGICLFASRDLTQVKSTQAPANPGSSRQYDFSDALYIGMALSQENPTQYIRFGTDGVTIVSPMKITLQAPEIDLIGPVKQTNGTMTSDTDVLAGSPQISLFNHLHTSESPGTPTSPPLP
jgi:hypothetical protein